MRWGTASELAPNASGESSPTRDVLTAARLGSGSPSTPRRAPSLIFFERNVVRCRTTPAAVRTLRHAYAVARLARFSCFARSRSCKSLERSSGPSRPSGMPCDDTAARFACAGLAGRRSSQLGVRAGRAIDKALMSDGVAVSSSATGKSRRSCRFVHVQKPRPRP